MNIDVIYSKAKAEINSALVDANFNHANIFSRFGIDDDFLKNLIVTSLANYNFLENSKKFPNYLHRLWLTDPQRPCMPYVPYIERYAKQVNSIKSDASFIFWHNSVEVEKYLKENFSLKNIKYKNIEDFDFGLQLNIKIKNAINARKFVLAGDIVKYAIIYYFGGIYSDMGLDFKDELILLTRHSDISLFLDGGLFFQPAYMGAPPRSDIFSIWLKSLENPEYLSALMFNSNYNFTAGTEIWMHGGFFFTIIFLSYLKENYNFLPIAPNKGLLHCESQSSWYKEGKFGNATINSSVPNLINIELHQFISSKINQTNICNFQKTRAHLDYFFKNNYLLN